MIDNNKIETLLVEQEDIDLAKVDGDGYHYEITVVSPTFRNMSRVKRQQRIYALLKEWITEGSLHAVTMMTLTPEEWEKKNG